MSLVPEGIPFSQVLCHLCKVSICMGANPCHFEKKKKYSQFFNQTRYTTLHYPPYRMQARLKYLREFIVCRSLHRSSVSPMHLLSAPLCSSAAVRPQTHSGALHAASRFIVTGCDVFKAGGGNLLAPFICPVLK